MEENSTFEIQTRKEAVKRAFLIIFFVLGLIYLWMPGADSIDHFSPLPASVKSDLDGDTWQNPNIAAYFSDHRREFITNFYKNNFSKTLIDIPLPVISLNHPPEAAYRYVRDQQESTFLEEYIMPLRESLFVNGYEPEIENQILKRKADFVGNHIYFKEKPYNSKTTLRFYPTSPLSKILVYIGIWTAGLILWRLAQKIIREKY